MATSNGQVGVQRTLESIIVGTRHRTDLGDLDALVDSIRREGLLQPITVTPEGVLVCGRRRLEALRRLGQRTTNVWVRSGITDRLSQLLAEQNDNALHKPLSLIEAEALYRELKPLLAEEAAGRQAATRFGTADIAGASGAGDSPAPEQNVGEAREQAARMITGTDSHQRLERFGRLKDLARDESLPEHIRERAAAEVAKIEAGGKVHGSHLRMNTTLDLDALDQVAADPAQPELIRAEAERSAAALRDAEDTLRTAELARLAAEAVARVQAAKAGKRGKKAVPPVAPVEFPVVVLPPRAFVALWADLDGWTAKYDAATLADTLTPAEWARAEAVLEETTAFFDIVRSLRTSEPETEDAELLAG